MKIHESLRVNQEQAVKKQLQEMTARKQDCHGTTPEELGRRQGGTIWRMLRQRRR